METFSALLALCVGNSPVTGEFPVQRPVTRSFDVFFDLCLNKRLSKQWWGWWFETLSGPLWRRCNGPVSNIFFSVNDILPRTSIIEGKLLAWSEMLEMWGEQVWTLISMPILVCLTFLTSQYQCPYLSASHFSHLSINANTCLPHIPHISAPL